MGTASAKLCFARASYACKVHAKRSKGSAAEQAAYLDSVCDGDAALRRQVEKLLAAYPKVGGFLNKPVGEQLAAATVPSDVTQEYKGKAGREGPGRPRSESKKGGSAEIASRLPFLSPSRRADSLGRIGHYEVLQILGKGGCGIVFRAFDELLQRGVALKVLAPTLAATSKARKRGGA